MGWILIPCLVKLRAEFNELAPDRGKASDGSIGDSAHQQEVSDHNPDETGSVPIHDADHVNEVHAIDVDVDLRVPGLSMETVVQFLLSRCRSRAEKRLRYIIYNERIWEASNGWRQRSYSGRSPHKEHAHFSASYDSDLEASTVSWCLEDIPVAISDADLAKIGELIDTKFARGNQGAKNDNTVTSKIGQDAFDQGVPNAFQGKKTPAWELLGDCAEALNTIVGLLKGKVSK
jgi:hypothetical protein